MEVLWEGLTIGKGESVRWSMDDGETGPWKE